MRSRVADYQRDHAPELESRDEAWFLNQLQRRCPEVYEKGKDFRILCPFHADNDPSLGVDKHGGYFKCWSCGASGGWNALVHKLGGMDKLQWRGGRSEANATALREVTQASDEIVRSLTKMGVKQRRRVVKGEISQPLVRAWPAGRHWRGLDGELLSRLGCMQVDDIVNNNERIGLPIRTPAGSLIGYTCRVLDPPDAEPKYIPLSADRLSWRDKELPTGSALFLADQVLEKGWDRAVLVEGPYDALNLYARGVPALGILGTSNWTSTKAAMVMGLGLRAALVMMDNDKAGHAAQPVVIASLQGLRVRGIKLPAGAKDPGDLTPKQVAWVKTKLDAM